MNLLLALSSFALSATPVKKQRVKKGAAKAIVIERVVPGAKQFIPHLREWAEHGKFTFRGLSTRIEGFEVLEDIVNVRVISAAGVANLSLNYPDQATKSLLHGEWVKSNGWEVRFDEGFQLPFSMQSIPDGRFGVCPFNLEVRYDFPLLRKIVFRVRRFECNEMNSNVVFKGLKRFFVAPRLVWGD